jgi:hypothetical protein
MDAGLKDLRARSFVVEDVDGQARGFLGLLDGDALLVLMDASGAPRLHASVGEDGTPSVQFLDDDGHIGLSLGVTTQPLIRMSSADRDLAVRIEIDPSFGGSVILTGRDGQSAQVQAEHPNYGPTIGLYDSRGMARVSAALARDDPASATMIDQGGVPMVALADSNGNPRVLLGASDSGGVQDFLNADRTTVQHLPKTSRFG